MNGEWVPSAGRDIEVECCSHIQVPAGRRADARSGGWTGGTGARSAPYLAWEGHLLFDPLLARLGVLQHKIDFSVSLHTVLPAVDAVAFDLLER